MNREDIFEIVLAVILCVTMFGLVIMWASKSKEENEYKKECERKAILYDYLMEESK